MSDKDIFENFSKEKNKTIQIFQDLLWKHFVSKPKNCLLNYSDVDSLMCFGCMTQEDKPRMTQQEKRDWCGCTCNLQYKLSVNS